MHEISYKRGVAYGIYINIYKYIDNIKRSALAILQKNSLF